MTQTLDHPADKFKMEHCVECIPCSVAAVKLAVARFPHDLSSGYWNPVEYTFGWLDAALKKKNIGECGHADA